MAEITIIHDHESGTRLTGSQKGDGVLEIVQRYRFIWRRYAGVHIPSSRDRMANRWAINGAAKALEAAGHTVAVDIDDTPRPTAVVEAERAERAESRADRYAERAEKHAARGNALSEAGREMFERIPPGQPMMPDHYSYARDLSYRRRAQAKEDKGRAELRYAEHLANRAEAAGSNQAHRENPRTTLRRIDKLEADRRAIERTITGYTRNFLNGRGEVYTTETHKPASGEYLVSLQQRRDHLAEQIAYWRKQLADVPLWGPQHFRRGDDVLVRGTWYPVKRVNKKSVSVPWQVAYQQGTETDHTDTVPYDDVFGRRRDGVELRQPPSDAAPAPETAATATATAEPAAT